MAFNSSGTPNPDRVLAGLTALLTPREVTKDLLRKTLDLYPELLAESVEVIGQALADYQQNMDARDGVLRMVTLLRQCRQLGVETAISRHMAQVAATERERRLNAERARQAHERRRLPSLSELTSPVWAQGEVFQSLAECKAWFQREYAQSNTTIEAVSVEEPRDKGRFETTVPRYVYRGESGAFSSTMSSLDRLLMGSTVSPEGVEDLVRTRIRLRRDLEAMGLSRLEAEGFLQHYGIPTHYLDVTANLDVAVSFASDLGIGSVGALCVMDMSALATRMQLVDLRGHPDTAQRPYRQAAFAITDPERIHRDLKDLHTISECGAQWFRFIFTEADTATFLPNPWLLDAHSDRAAGLIELLINGYGKVHDECAQWLSQHLQPAPFVFVTMAAKDPGDGVVAQWVSADEAGVPYVQGERSDSNYRLWSTVFSEPVPAPLPRELLLDDLTHVTPGATLLVMSRRGLEALAFTLRQVSKEEDKDG